MENHGQQPREDFGGPTLAQAIDQSRRSMIKRWLMNLELTVMPPPNDLTFKEINLALDQIVERVNECRKLYPWSAPKTPTDAILRSLPPGQRSERGQTERVDISA